MPCLKAAIDRIGLVKFVEGVEKASGQGWQTRFIVLSQKPSYFYSNLLRLPSRSRQVRSEEQLLMKR